MKRVRGYVLNSDSKYIRAHDVSAEQSGDVPVSPQMAGKVLTKMAEGDDPLVIHTDGHRRVYRLTEDS